MAVRTISTGVLATCAVVLALAILLWPTPSSTDQVGAARAAVGRAAIKATGNSVITHRSKCDADTRTLPQMMGAADLSFPGETLAEGLNVAGLALRRGRPGTVVLMVSLSQLAAERREDLRSALFFRLAGIPLTVNGVAARIAALEPVTASPEREQTAFRYAGTDYPAYDQLKTRYLLPERLAMGCPETLGRNRRFIEALYWNNYLRMPLHLPYWRDLATLAADAGRGGNRLLIVLMPVDFGDVATLNPRLDAALRARRDAALARTRAAGLPLLDLSEALPAEAFADRWCGCGHLAAQGRRTVAARIAAAMGQAGG